MNVSGPVRVFALVGALAAAGLAAWLFFLGGFSPAAASEPVREIKPLYSAGGTASAPAPVAKPKVKRVTKAAPVASPKPKAAPPAAPARAKPAAKEATKRIANPNGLPLALARALAGHPVVVVSLYDPEGKVDGISLGEAKAGAERAGVGFVALNVLDPRASEALTRKLGVLSAPAFFLYKRPGELVMRVDGFADRDLVAQAAVSILPPSLAARPVPAQMAQARWSARANAICRERGGLARERLRTRKQLLNAGPRLVAELKRSLARLRALPLPTSRAGRARTNRLLALWEGIYALNVQAVKATGAGQLGPIVARRDAHGRQANRLAVDLGADACAVAVKG